MGTCRACGQPDDRPPQMPCLLGHSKADAPSARTALKFALGIRPKDSPPAPDDNPVLAGFLRRYQEEALRRADAYAAEQRFLGFNAGVEAAENSARSFGLFGDLYDASLAGIRATILLGQETEEE